MTLFNQIRSFLFGLFLLVMFSLVYFQFTQTKEFMDTQIESDLNNTTHALSLMLKPHLETGDIAAAETVINVIFEGGFYKKVSLTWLSDQTTQKWENPILVDGVPDWFLGLDLFEQKNTTSTINNGWMQLATLEIEANPAIGYRQLWNVMSDTLLILFALLAASLIVLQLRLTKILTPLHRVASQAKLIAKREFQPDLALPETTELKEVVLAMNSMSKQLQNVFSQLDKEVVTLKNDKLTDSVSQLPNRLFLNAQLQSWIVDPGYGGVLIARLDWLETIHKELGYQVRDNTIRVLAKEMQETLPNIAPCIIARISKREFAFLVTKATSEQLKKYLQNLIRLINQARQNTHATSQGFAIGMASRTDDITASQLLANADNALKQALEEDKVSHYYQNDEKQGITISQWQEHLQEAIEERQFLLQWHPAISFKTNDILHREIYTRLDINGELIRAAQFMPNIEHLALGSQFDKSLLEAISANAKINQQRVAINITQDSIVDDEFHLWLDLFLSRQNDATQFYFEVRESTVLTHPELSLHFSNIIKDHGANIGIDNCGREMGSLVYLQTIKPNYVKLDQSLSCNPKSKMEMGELQEQLELTQAVVKTARGLDIDVIITGVEDNEQLDIVSELQATGYQGFITAPSDIN